MRIALVGVGLIGGSIGLAARERLGATVNGYDTRGEALQIALQGERFPNELLQTLPYVVTMLALAGFIGRAVPPRAIGVPYDPEQS